jgi:hypothetical protein
VVSWCCHGMLKVSINELLIILESDIQLDYAQGR